MLQAELIADGLGFPEGPVAMDDGSVIVVEIRRGAVTRIFPGGSKQIVARVGGGPNGAAVGPDGALYICNNGGRFTWVEQDGAMFPGPQISTDYRGGAIQRVDLKSAGVSELYTHYKGERLLGPNDIVFDRSGGFWFTDYGGSAGDVLQYGSLYYGRIDGSPLLRARRNLLTPNGVGLSPEEDILYFAETVTGRLWACPIVAPGKLAPATHGPGRLLHTLPNYQMFDSMAVEASGRVCVASIMPGAITIVGPDEHVEQVPCPDPVTTNICFGAADGLDAYITASSTGCLYKMRWPRAGLKLNYTC